jgi:hypothetical protein
MENKADVVIVGGGIAGMVCALELLDLGKKVILVDRDTEERFGGLARWSFGGMFFVNTPQQRRAGIKDSVDLALKDWHSFAEFDEDAELPKQWAEKYVNECTDQVFGWLTRQGVKYFPVVHWVERGLYRPGNSVPRFHMVWGTGKGLTDAIMNSIMGHSKRDHLQIFYRHKVEDFELSGGMISGVTGIREDTGESFHYEADQVVIASGGVGGNIQKVRKHWPEEMGKTPEVILNGSDPISDGDLHDQAEEKLDARITHMSNMWNYAAGIHHHRPHHPDHGLSLVPVRSALWMNYRGERIGPMPLITSFDTRYLVQRICQEEKQYSWHVMNMKIAVKELAISGSEFNHAIREKKFLKFVMTVLFGNKSLVNELLEENEDFVTANSIEELAEKMNALNGNEDVDVNLLKEGIRDYDAQIDRGKKYFNDEQLRRLLYLRQYRGDRARLCKFQKILDPRAMPLIAIRQFILSRKSLGGLQTDLNCRVMDQSGNTIPGLYGVGEASGFGGGGIHGKRSLEGTFLGTCVLTGRVAAKAIARG